MTSKRTIRIGLGALAATLALAASVLADAPADASTAAAQGPTTSCNGSSVCSYDSGWMTYGDGGCEVDTTVGYLTGYDQITVGVQVKSPRIFASCTAYPPHPEAWRSGSIRRPILGLCLRGPRPHLLGPPDHLVRQGERRPFR